MRRGGGDGVGEWWMRLPRLMGELDDVEYRGCGWARGARLRVYVAAPLSEGTGLLLYLDPWDEWGLLDINTSWDIEGTGA